MKYTSALTSNSGNSSCLPLSLTIRVLLSWMVLQPCSVFAEPLLLACTGTRYFCQKSESFDSCLKNASRKRESDSVTVSIDTERLSASVTLFIETTGKLEFSETEFFVEAPVRLGPDPTTMIMRIWRVTGQYMYMLSKSKNGESVGVGLGDGTCSAVARRF